MLVALVCSAVQTGRAVAPRPPSPPAAEQHADRIVQQVLENVKKIKAADPMAVPMAFWDFDGTIIKGEGSEGLVETA